MSREYYRLEWKVSDNSWMEFNDESYDKVRGMFDEYAARGTPCRITEVVENLLGEYK